MKRMTRTRMVVLSAALGAILGGSALAQEKTPPAPQMTKEQRMKMATAHEQMAACLRTDRPLADCHQEMMKTCQDTMGTGAGMCPMMGGMGMGHGMMMHKGQGTPTQTTPTPPKK